MIGQVVVGIDGSAHSLTAFQYAIDLARSAKAELKLVFVVDSRKTDLPIVYTASHFDYGFERVYVPPEPGLKDFYERVRRDIRAFADRCVAACRTDAEAQGVRFQHLVRDGLPSTVLTEEARSGDLLVVGQRGENARFARAIVGSTTEDVVRSSPRPVLVTPLAFRSPQRLLFPYDGSPSAETALRFYVNMLHGITGELVVLSVTEQMEENFPYEQEFSYLGTHGITCRFVVETGRPIEVIPNVAQRENADIILVGAHGKQKLREYLLGSTASHLIRRSDLAVLVVF
jgi:nucleotide-binding universal stress UspA family protein